MVGLQAGWALLRARGIESRSHFDLGRNGTRLLDT
jgi:hypothetical protein